MAISTCVVSGNVKNLLNQNVQNVTVKAYVDPPFFHPSGPSWIDGAIASTTTDASGNFSLTVIETTTVGQRMHFQFEYTDGVSSNTLRRQYAVVVPSGSADLSALVAQAVVPSTITTIPASSVVVTPSGNLSSIDGQSAFQELQSDIDALNTLQSGRIYVGNGSNVATEVAPSGDLTMDNAGAFTLGTVPVSKGGTGQTTQQAAMDALAGAQSSGKYLRSDGTHTTLSSISAGDVPTLNQNTTGTAANVTGTVAIANGGTGQTAKTAAFDALSPNTTLGDATYHNGTNNVRLAGNTTATKKYLSQTGNGSVSAAPAWSQPAFSELSGNISTSQMNSGTGASNTTFYRGDGTWAAPTITTTNPTIQKLTSGTSATYTLPAGVKWIRVRMVGAGGGSAGSGASAGAGGSGGNTTFGTLTANGGGGGGLGGASGGGGSIGAGFSGIILAGGGGGAAQSLTSATGGVGGNSVFGGGGPGMFTGNAGTIGAANTGGGASGAGGANGSSGAGGGGGGYVEAIATSPSATYTYTIGSGGTAGSAGTSGFAGAVGGSGVIYVEEFYQ
jgi:hypothetical protein